MVLGAVLSSSVVELMLFGDENTYFGEGLDDGVQSSCGE
jgi:hypothetical protein